MPKVAAVQFAPKYKDQLGNLRQVASLAIEAAENGSQLIVLPELTTTGYSFMSVAEAAPFAEVITEFNSAAPVPQAGQSTHPSMRVMFAICQRYDTHIAWGLIEKDAGTEYLYNTQVLMCPDGRYEFYRKVNHWGNDMLWAHEGRANPPVLRCTLGGSEKKVGLLICRDVRDKKNDHWDSFYQRGDADLVAFSANWGEGGFPATAWMDFVKDNRATLIVSNRYGQEGAKPNNFGGGGSCIITTTPTRDHPNGVYCDGLVFNQDCIVYADV